MNKSNFNAFRMLLLGRSGVGKTYNGLKWALDYVKKGLFKPKRVLIVSKTWRSDPSQEEFISYCQKKYDKFKDMNCFEELDLDLIAKLFDTQKFIKDTQPSKMKNWLVIFDDQISSNLIKKSTDPTLKNIFCVGRHYGIS